MLNSPAAAIFVTILLALAGVASDYFLKVASGSPRPVANLHFLAGLIIAGSLAFGWVVVMPKLKLAYIGVIYSLTIVLFLALVGHFVFKESLRPMEWLGVGLAVVSLMLLYHRAA